MIIPDASSLVPSPRGSGVVFVTGAGGFIGRHVVSAFQTAGWTVGAFGRHAPTDVPELLVTGHHFDGRLSAERLTQAAAYLGPPAAIVHAAGAGSVGPSLLDPTGDFERNVGSVLETLEFMRASASRARLIYLSSAAIYGAGHDGPIREDAALAPISPYGVHKRVAETLIAGWSDLYGLDACILRLFSVYGPGIRKQLLWDIASRLRAGASLLRLGGSGQEERDYLHIDDAVRLMGWVVAAENPPSIVNGGAGGPATVAEVAGLMCGAAGGQTQPAFDGQIRAGDPASLVADIALARGLGFVPRVTLDEGAKTFYAWASSLP